MNKTVSEAIQVRAGLVRQAAQFTSLRAFRGQTSKHSPLCDLQVLEGGDGLRRFEVGSQLRVMLNV